MTTTTTELPRPIGFIDHAAVRARATGQAQGAQTRLQAQTTQPEDTNTLLRFDGNETVSFLDASHNTMVLGTTGSGKTASILLPAFDRLCRAGYGGIAVDSKGSLSPLLRAVARRHGREADVVEIGPYEGAARLNMLADRTRAEAGAILEPLLLGYCAHDTDRYWRQTGFEQFMDGYEIADALCRRAGVPVGLHVPARMLAEREYALACYEKFKRCASSPAERDLVARIEDTGAHIVPCSKKRMEEKVWREQTTYYASAIRTGMSMLKASPGILPNFFAADGQSFAPGAWVFDQRRIVVLRLSPDSGEMGAGLARLLLRQFYGSVFARGKSQPIGQYVFALADELQDYVSTDPTDALNDSAFLAKCREFRCIFLGGTQSAIALSQRSGGGLADVRAMLNNTNVRIFFYSDDPETQRLAGVAAENVLLHELESGQCLLAHYDATTRRHEAGVTSAGAMYKALRPVLDDVQPAEDRTAVSAPDEAGQERARQDMLVAVPVPTQPTLVTTPVPAQPTPATDEIVEETPAETAMTLVQLQGADLAHVPNEHRTPAVCLVAVQNDARALRFVPEALKTPELCLEAVRQGGQALKFVPEALKTPELCLEAVTQDGLALDAVPEALKTPEICLAAVRQAGVTLGAVPAWRRTPAVCLAAVQNNGSALEFVPARLRSPTICLAAVRQNGWALKFVPEALKTAELCLEALRRSPGVAHFVPNDVPASTSGSDPATARHPRTGVVTGRSGRSGGSRLAGSPCRPSRRRHRSAQASVLKQGAVQHIQK